MIQKVRFTYTVDVFIKGDSEEQIEEYMRDHTPAEAFRDASKSGHYIDDAYDEFVLCDVRDNRACDIDLTEKGGN